MEKRIAVVTDSSCDLPDELIAQYGITLVPLRVTIDGKEYRDRVDLDSRRFFELLDRCEEIPKTSCPTQEDILQTLDGLKAQGFTDVLYISISSALSGSYNAVRLAIEGYEGMNIVLHDTHTLSMGLGACVLEAGKCIQQGKSIGEALERVRQVRRQMSAFFVVNTLEYLRKGGRIGAVEGTLGTILGIKPLITVGLEDGAFKVAGKVKGFKRALNHMIDQVQQGQQSEEVCVAVIHADALEEARGLMERLRGVLHIKEEIISALGPAMGTHVGKGMLGVISYKV
jgi:DegV family protein with EDD domain